MSNSNQNLKFENIIVEAKANELYTEFTTTIKLTNLSNDKVELNLSIPLEKNTVFQKFEAKKGEEKIISKVYKKEKAEEKYSDSTAQGNNAFLTKMSDSGKSIDVFLGNLEVKQDFEIKLFSLQLNYTSDKSICFSYTPASLPCISGFNLNNEFTTSAIGVQLNSLLIVKSSLTRFICPNYKFIKPIFSNDLLSVEFTIESKDFVNNFKNVEVLFRTVNISQSKIIEEYDPNLQLYTYNLNFLFDKYDNIKSSLKDQTLEIDTDAEKEYSKIYDGEIINDFPAYFTFIVDQSGSMSGNSMELAKESLTLFLKSLPRGSKFDIIGFGSSEKTYFDTVQDYNNETLIKAFEIVKGIEANLGGTDLDIPMTTFYSEGQDNKKRYVGKDKPRHLFILTDGDTSNAQKCLNLADVNSSEVKVHCIGIGTGVNKNFILDMGRLGQGTSHLVPDTSNLKKVVISALNNALKPYIKIESVILPNDVAEEMLAEYSNSQNLLTIQDNIFNYSFITKNKLADNSAVVLKYFDVDGKGVKTPQVIVTSINDESLIKVEGNSLNKLVIGLSLKEEKNKEISNEKEKNNEKFTELGIKFQVLSPYTSLFGEILSNSINESEVKTVKLESKAIYLSKNENKALEGLSYNQNQNFITNAPVHRNIQLQSCARNLSCKAMNYDQYVCLGKRSDESLFSSKQLEINTKSSGSGGFLSKLGNSIKSIFSRSKKSNNDDEEKYMPKQQSIVKNDLQEKVDMINMNLSSKSYKCDSIPEIETKSSKNKIDSNSKDLYSEIIDSQGFDGIWKNGSSSKLDTTASSNYKSSYDSILAKLNNLKTTFAYSNADITLTILVLLILEKEFIDRKDEYLLIKNKSLKVLQMEGIDFKSFSL